MSIRSSTCGIISLDGNDSAITVPALDNCAFPGSVAQLSMLHLSTLPDCFSNKNTVAALAIIMLDTSFARPLGDAGNEASWPFPVLIERVPAAFAKPVVSGQFADVVPFIEAGRRLIKRGACAITTTFGFLVRHQQRLQSQFTVPVLTITLTQFARLQETLGLQRVAILTIDATAPDAPVRAVAGIPDDALVFSLPRDSHFVSAILRGTVDLNVNQAEIEWVTLALTCQRDHPDIGLWLFECANMPPYAVAVASATGLPVYDALTMGHQLFASASAMSTA